MLRTTDKLVPPNREMLANHCLPTLPQFSLYYEKKRKGQDSGVLREALSSWKPEEGTGRHFRYIGPPSP